MITAHTLFLLAIFPALTLMIENRTATALIVATGVLCALGSTSVGVALVARRRESRTWRESSAPRAVRFFPVECVKPGISSAFAAPHDHRPLIRRWI
jgi:hypothetical protein